MSGIFSLAAIALVLIMIAWLVFEVKSIFN